MHKVFENMVSSAENIMYFPRFCAHHVFVYFKSVSVTSVRHHQRIVWDFLGGFVVEIPAVLGV